MIFTDLTAGAPVFLDANTLLYHFTADANYGAACTDLLERAPRTFRGATTTLWPCSIACTTWAIRSAQQHTYANRSTKMAHG